MKKNLLFSLAAGVLASSLPYYGSPPPCSSPNSPAGHAVCLGIPDGPHLPVETNCPILGPTNCDPLNWDGAKFTTIGLTTSPTRTDFYFVAQNNRILHNFFDHSNNRWGPPPPAPNTSNVLWTFAEDGEDPDLHQYKTTVGLGTVLHQEGVDFIHPVSSAAYDYAMYMVYQFDPALNSAGHVCVSFSNNGTTGWTSPIRVIDQANITNCMEGPNLVHPGCDELEDGHPEQPRLPDCRLEVEAFSGFLLPNPESSNGTALFAGLEGDLEILSCSTYGNGSLPENPLTRTSLYKLSTSSPDQVEVVGDLTGRGLSAPTFSRPTGNRHFMFINLEFAYDPRREQVLLTRLYPFPFDHESASGGECSGVPPFWNDNTLSFLGLGTPDGNAPCDPSPTLTNFCPTNVGTHPMRAQIYSNLLRTIDVESIDDSIEALVDRPWTLEADWGRSTGWSTTVAGGSCGSRYPINQPFMVDIGIDIDSLGFLKSPEGWIPEGPSIRTFLGGFRDRNNACQSATYGFQHFLQAYQYTRDLAWDHLFKDGFESGTFDNWDLE